MDLKTWTVSPASQEAQEKSDWDIIGDADAWEKVIRRDLNLNVALRSCQLRYCDETHAGPQVSEARIGILASMLGLAVWSPAVATEPAAAPVIILSYQHSGARFVQEAIAEGTDLACTAGTGILPECAVAMTAWSRIDGRAAAQARRSLSPPSGRS